MQDPQSTAEERLALPSELLEYIAIHSDPHTCLVLALMCRALSGCSRRLTFQEIAVHQPHTPGRPRLAITTFASLLGSPLCTFKRYTKRLTLPSGQWNERVALPKLRYFEILWTTISDINVTRDDAFFPITDETLGQLRSLRIKIRYRPKKPLQSRLFKWLLLLPQLHPIGNLGITLHGYDTCLSSSLREFMHRTRRSLAELSIYPDEYGFRGYDPRDLGFSQYLTLHTITLEPVSLLRVRTRHWRHDGRFVRFLLQALAAPALRNVVVRLKVDDEISILDREPEQPNWAALDDGLAQCSQLEQVSFELSLASSHVEHELAKRAMDESMTAIPQLLPRTHFEGKLWYEQSLQGICMDSSSLSVRP
ncbi:hypothetical protein GGG16DRAFT_112385 [Schizophyllum commune]